MVTPPIICTVDEAVVQTRFIHSLPQINPFLFFPIFPYFLEALFEAGVARREGETTNVPSFAICPKSIWTASAAMLYIVAVSITDRSHNTAITFLLVPPFWTLRHTT